MTKRLNNTFKYPFDCLFAANILFDIFNPSVPLSQLVDYLGKTPEEIKVMILLDIEHISHVSVTYLLLKIPLTVLTRTQITQNKLLELWYVSAL